MAEPWAPSLSDVGGRIPTRTLDVTVPGDDTPTGTFTDRTMPTAAMVQPIVDGAAAAVANAVGLVPPKLYELANSAAAWRAAADIELGWPDRNADIRAVYEPLDARARLELQRLVDACEDAGTGADGGTPAWSFPPPPPWGDDYL